MASYPSEVFAVIVGGGPIGLTVALALAHYGYSSVVLERHAERMDQPKAHVLNPRTLEIYRQLGIDLEVLRKAGVPPHEADVVRFAESMIGHEYAVIDRLQDPDQSISPEPMFNVAQPFLEEHLLNISRATGNVAYFRQSEWQTANECAEGILSRVFCKRSQSQHTIISKYLIGCDGAKARSRDALAIQFDPLHGTEQEVLHYVSIHFKADLSHMKTGLLWFIVNKGGTGTFIAYNRKSSWVYFTRYNPVTSPKSTFTSEYLKQLVFRAIGKEIPDYQEIGITIWTTSPQLARTYRSPIIRNAFLAGDAAHSFPPTGGLGVNTGVADVQNLVWKIHAVESQWADPTLLDSVTAERLPVARENCRQSKVNERKIFRLIDGIIQHGLTAQEILSNPAMCKEIQRDVDENREHFHSLNLQLGYVYGRNMRRGPSDYQKEAVPGARLPHFWIEKNGRKLSTLDLIDGMGFILLCTPGFTNFSVLDAGRAVAVEIRQIGRDFHDPSGDFTRFLHESSVESLLIRPDQHIVGPAATSEAAILLLSRYLGC